MTERLRAIRGVADVKLERGSADGGSQLLFGEHFDVEQIQGDWAFGRCVHDGFTGYVCRDALSTELTEPTHSVCVLWAPVLHRSGIKPTPRDFLCLGSRLRIVEQRYQFYCLEEDAWVYKAHVVEGALRQPDYMVTAERLIGVPFVWGGRSTYGLDCTGIIQLALGLAGIAAPRDIPEQLAELGCPVETPQRGDLFFLERAGELFHAGLFTSDTHVITASERFANVSVLEFSQVYHGYRLREELNGTADQYRVHLRRIAQQERSR